MQEGGLQPGSGTLYLFVPKPPLLNHYSMAQAVDAAVFKVPGSLLC